MHGIILAVGLFMLGCGEVTLGDVDAMTCPVEPEPVQCEQCETLCPETGWGIAYADIFSVIGPSSLEYGGFAVFVNTGTDAQWVTTPTVTGLSILSSGVDVQVQAGTELAAAWVQPGTVYGAVDVEAADILTEAGSISDSPVEDGTPLLTWQSSWSYSSYASSAATKLIELEFDGLPGRAVFPLTVHSNRFGCPDACLIVKAHSARFVCAQVDE